MRSLPTRRRRTEPRYDKCLDARQGPPVLTQLVANWRFTVRLRQRSAHAEYAAQTGNTVRMVCIGYRGRIAPQRSLRFDFFAQITQSATCSDSIAEVSTEKWAVGGLSEADVEWQWRASSASETPPTGSRN